MVSKDLTIDEIISYKPARVRKHKTIHPDSPHCYEEVKTPNGKTQYVCSLPKCTHMLNIPQWIVGKESLCSSCYKSFIIGEDRVLKCEDCIEKRDWLDYG